MSVGLLLVDTLVVSLAVTSDRSLAESEPVLAVLVLVAVHAAALYRTRLTLSVLDDLPRLLGAVAFATFGTMAVATLGVDADNLLGIAKQAAPIALFVTAGRTLAYPVIRLGRARGWFAYRTVIVGTAETAVRLGQAIRQHPEHGLRLVGFVEDGPPQAEQLPGPVLTHAGELPSLIDRQEIAVVVVAFGNSNSRDLVTPLRRCAAAHCQIFVVPRLFELHSHGQLDRISSLPLLRLRRAAVQGISWRAKRLFDLVLSGLALVVSAPVLLATAVAVRIESGPGVLFRQQRIGHGGREFTLYKFRSLTPVSEHESETRWNVTDDDRVGPVGRLIRRTSLDELPQLLNVLRGDMSLVGPRPERPHFVEQFSDAIASYAHRHRVPAGMTGWAAVNGLRGNTSIEQRANFDNYYIDNWSLWLDVKILLWTLPAVLRGHDG